MSHPRLRLINRPGRLIVQLQVEPKDLWIGCFWQRTPIALHIYICLIPMVPLHITLACGPRS